MPRSPEAFAKVLVLGIVVSQRLALPLGSSGQVPLVVLLSLAALIVGWRNGLLRLDTNRARLYLLSVASAALASLVQIAFGLQVSWLAIVFFILLYLPACFMFANLSLASQRAVLWFFVRLMSFIALTGLAAFVAQFLGYPYEDLLGRVIPERFLQTGYVTSYPIYFGSAIYRANGLIFLEPSFFSLFCGLALLVLLYLRRRSVHMLVLTVALIAAVSGNGFVVLGAGARPHPSARNTQGPSHTSRTTRRNPGRRFADSTGRSGGRSDRRRPGFRFQQQPPNGPALSNPPSRICKFHQSRCSGPGSRFGRLVRSIRYRQRINLASRSQGSSSTAFWQGFVTPWIPELHLPQ